ncbi:hypothetical protein FGO68_gene10743 [Halteria grandinella]|uniref:Uncharacterized protein n=1 Tax=Halteria grandinella TaxID=5974 RepID=A0A8J8NF45_HALGN|nr:hypothetical protein FGO68_gene10743 [Halteria grandinella]
MIKRQLGGMLEDYIAHKQDIEVPKNKQNDNMKQCVNDFALLKIPPANSFPIHRVQDLPQKPQTKAEHLQFLSHLSDLNQNDIIACSIIQCHSHELQVIGTSKGIYINQSMDQISFHESETYAIDTYQRNQSEKEQTSDDDEAEQIPFKEQILDGVVEIIKQQHTLQNLSPSQGNKKQKTSLLQSATNIKKKHLNDNGSVSNITTVSQEYMISRQKVVQQHRALSSTQYQPPENRQGGLVRAKSGSRKRENAPIAVVDSQAFDTVNLQNGIHKVKQRVSRAGIMSSGGNNTKRQYPRIESAVVSGGGPPILIVNKALPLKNFQKQQQQFLPYAQPLGRLQNPYNQLVIVKKSQIATGVKHTPPQANYQQVKQQSIYNAYGTQYQSKYGMFGKVPSSHGFGGSPKNGGIPQRKLLSSKIITQPTPKNEIEDVVHAPQIIQYRNNGNHLGGENPYYSTQQSHQEQSNDASYGLQKLVHENKSSAANLLLPAIQVPSNNTRIPMRKSAGQQKLDGVNGSQLTTKTQRATTTGISGANVYFRKSMLPFINK